MTELLERFANLPPDRRQLVLKKLRNRAQPATEDTTLHAAPILPALRGEDLPLSFSQVRFWVIDKLTAGSSNMSLPVVVRLKGKLSIAALQHTFNEILRRHEILRTNFRDIEGEPRQVIAPRRWLSVLKVDVTDGSASELMDQAQLLITLITERPFDLSRDPLVRVFLFRLSDLEHVLCVNLHHIVFDGWSEGILTEEVVTIYSAFSAGTPSPLLDLPIQYADYAVWQREWLQGKVLEDLLAYWRKQLGGGVGVVDLPYDRPRASAKTFLFGKCEMRLPRPLSEAARALSRREGSTLFMVLLAIFYMLLYRYSGEEDLAVGTLTANRSRSQVEGLIGLFLNTLVLRANLGRDPSFREVIRRVRETTAGAYQHQDLPVEKLLEVLQSERDVSFTPLFGVMFGMHTETSVVREISTSDSLGVSISSGLDTQTIDVAKRSRSLGDLALTIEERGVDLVAVMGYNSDLFDGSTITRMLRHFQGMLQTMLDDPDLLILAAKLLSDAERHQMLVEWGTAPWGGSPDLCIDRLFVDQVNRAPDATAVVFANDQLSYGALNTRSNRLARYLRRLGVGPETVVGIHLERSLELIIAVWGTLKAGAAYLPLDTTHPAARMALMLNDSRVTVLLTQKSLEADLPEIDADIVCLDAEWELIGRENEEPPVSGAFAENLAYVVYTSGSTGTPKGVMVAHSGLVSSYLAWERVYRLRMPAGCHLQMASFSFDVFAGDLVRSLCSGGKLILCPQELLLEPLGLYELMRGEQVECAEFVPVVLRTLVQHLEETDSSLSFLSLLLAGSDMWFTGEYSGVRHRCGPGTRVINSYGVTEASIDSSYFEDEVPESFGDEPTPIGRPFDGVQTYLADRLLQPAPIGVRCELYIGGCGLARGYLNRPDLTADRFMPNSFNHVQGGRLYRTGDLARFRHDGNIRLIGRSDHQIKIRGFRIEPGEIEALLTQHPGVAGNAVVAREDVPGERRLVAYVVHPQQQPAPTVAEMHEFLAARLPDHMVPSAFVVLESLPLTPNGKIDRRALPAPGQPQPAEAEEFVAPDGPVETKLAAIWSEVLKIDQVGVFDNFFRLGGHSLMAIRVIHRVNQAFRIDLSVRRVFEDPTVAGLALVVEETLLERLEAEPQMQTETAVPALD